MFDRMSLDSTSELRAQAIRMRQEYPALYAYLARRDRVVRRTLAYMPDPADIELSAINVRWELIERLSAELQPGLSDLAGSE